MSPNSADNRSLWGIAWMSFFWSTATVMVFTLLPTFLTEVLGASKTKLGIIEGVAVFLAFLAKVFSGVLSDYWKSRKPLILGVRSAPTDALIADLSPQHKEGSSYGIRYTLYTLGAVFGGGIAAALMHLSPHNYRLVFWLSIIPADLGWSIEMLPLLMVAYDIVNAGISLPIGKLADKYNRHKILLSGMLLAGLHMGMTQGLIAALIAETTLSHLRGTAFALYYLTSGTAVLIGNSVAGYLSDVMGGAVGAFWGGAVFTVLAATYLVKVVKESAVKGNNVSHANNKTRRRFLPNLQETSLMSEALGRMVRMRLSTTGIRTIEFHGGLDSFLVRTPAAKLGPKVAALKKAVMDRIAAKPGPEIVKKMGGLQKFTGWKGPMLTDSGGFQIFSLGHGSVAAEIKGRRMTGRQKTLLKITEEGARFKSYRDLGADLIVVLDECTPYHVDKHYTAQSMQMSHRWALRSLAEFKRGDDGKQSLYGIIQGGVYPDLRASKDQMQEVVGITAHHLSRERPIHLLGIGGVSDIFSGVEQGIDTFDCVHPTRLARHGGAL
eukprot:gene13438-13553_t